MEKPRPGTLLATGSLLLMLQATGNAGEGRTIAFVPDPGCRFEKLTASVEEALEAHLRVENLRVLPDGKREASILLQYLILLRREGDRVVIQLDGRVFDNASGKLMVEGSAASDPHPEDEKNQKAAALQVGKKLVESLSPLLVKALSSKGKGRRIMLQITLEEGATSYRERLLRRLKSELGGMSPRMGASTERNLVVVITTSEEEKDLAQMVERVLVGGDNLQVNWVVQSGSALVLRLDRKRS